MTPLQHLIAVAQSQDMVWREDQAAPTASLLMPAMSAVFADPSRHWSIMAVYNRVPAALRDLRARNIRSG